MSPRRPIGVLLMTQHLGPGGTERQLAEIARSLDRARFSPHVACMVDGIRGQELRAAGVPILHLPLETFLSPASLRQALKLARYLREHRIRLVHAFDHPMICFGVPVGRLAGARVVLSSQRAHRCLSPPQYRFLQRATDYVVDGIVANCEAMRRHLVEDEKVAPGLIHLCYNGIDTERFHAAPRGAAPGGRLVIGVVSMLRPEKGLDTLLEAFAQVKDLNPALHLLLVGSGAMLPGLQSLAQSLGIAERCRFEPATNDVTQWLRHIDIFVLPSLSEALSNSLMEAMACGCAVVASKVGGNPELVLDGETGLLFEKADAAGLAARLRLLIEDEGLRRRLACAGAWMIREKFSLASSTRRMEQIYESFLE
jgi:glycosyltransferase involved in cell wall biosynthesis